MKLYRAVGFKEFAKVLLFQTIEGQQQNSCYCFENIDGEMVSMAALNVLNKPKSFVCAFDKPLCWCHNANVLLELEIPDEICTWGMGRYFSQMYNPYLEYIGNSGFEERALLQTTTDIVGHDIPEVHFPAYNIENVRAVYFPTEIRRETSLGLNDAVCYNTEYFNDLWLAFWRTTPQKLRYRSRFYQYLDCCMPSLTMGVVKAALTKLLIIGHDFDNLILDKELLKKVLNTFKTGSVNTLSKELSRKDWGYVRSLDVDDVDRMIQIAYGIGIYGGKHSVARFRKLKKADETNEKFQVLYDKFLARIATHSWRKDYEPYIGNIKNLIYSLATDAGVI